jgi:TetR/AcrR family transcriptional regulator, fatty acid biosynthesis regulator
VRKSPEKQQERERVRMTLMRATVDLAEAHGFSGLGLREISREAGIAPTSFYRHFADVEELGLGIIEYLVAPALRAIAEAAEAARASGHEVEVVIGGLLDAAVDDPALVRFVLAQQTGAHARFRRALHVQFETLLAVLRLGLPPGAPELAPAAALAGVLLGCDRILDAPPEERRELRTGLEPPIVEATRWLLRGSTGEDSAMNERAKRLLGTDEAQRG